PRPTAAPTTIATTTTAPPVQITAVPPPPNTGEPGYQWYVHPAGDGQHILLAVRRAAPTKRHPAVVLDDTSGGFNLDYLTFADELVAHGFDVVVGCLYSPPLPLDPAGRRIPCADAPMFDGLANSMVAALDGLVDAGYEALGRATPMAVMGFSRGAGVAAMRAAAGRPEPVLLISGKYEGWGDPSKPGGLVSVEERFEPWRAPALIMHGTADGAVPVQQAYTLEAALRAKGIVVESHYYEGSGHNLSGEPPIHDDFVNRTVAFVCARLGCPA
ncbi:MAG TPA: prolyl oligopeptidase family serine peptidase, partial [Acidimicrobiia bacterium]|nr:prolyl oligopeptidase family serine peptidase [Acidimicrobiia bacterium]